MGRKFDLTERERYQIEMLLKERYKIGHIAEVLDRHYMTIYRKIQRGTVELIDDELRPYKQYCADRGQAIADERKHEKGRELKVGNDLEFIRFLEMMILEKKYSPCAILAYIKNNDLHFKTEICYSTIYSYIDKHLFLNVTNDDLPNHGKSKVRKKKKQTEKSKICQHNIKGRSIEKRSDDIMLRDDFGHWEMDTVVGRRGGESDCLLVLTERKYRLEIVRKISSKSQKSVVGALDELERYYGFDGFCERFKTITMDNGVEFLDMQGVERSAVDSDRFRSVAYYCHPYCSFERGSNENANKLIRRWIPKGEDISQYTHLQIAYIEDWLNTYPRKIFGYLSSLDMYNLEFG